MIRFIAAVVALAVSLGASAQGDPSAKYVQLNFTIDIPQMEQAMPSATLVVGQPARLNNAVEEGVGYRLDVLAKRLFVDQKGRPLVELEWTLFSSEAGKLILKSETQTLVVANDDGATFTTAAADNEDDLVQVKVVTRIVPDAEIIAKLGKLPEVAACPADTNALVMPKNSGDCCHVGCGAGQVMTCCGAVWCCCGAGACCSPP